MKLTTTIIATLAVSLASGGVGLWLGQHGFGLFADNMSGADNVQVLTSEQTAAPRIVAYYTDPDGKPAYSATPKLTGHGRSFIAIYEDADPALKTPKSNATKSKHIRFYRNPMGLPDISQTPKKDSMGMDYLPVYADEEDEGSIVKISLGRLQRTGVRSELVQLQKIVTPVHAPATIQLDERLQSVIALRFEAYIEQVENVTTGMSVKKGQPLMKLYGSALSAAAAQYVSALASKLEGGSGVVRGARQRLENLGIPENVIREIERTKQMPLSLDWPAPRDGIIVERNAIDGMRAEAGNVLFRVADVSRIWVIADIAERDLSLIAVGQSATISPKATNGSRFSGKIALIYPFINKETRTARVRIELPNPNATLLPDMYADVDIATGSNAPVLTVPENAVIDSGTTQSLIIDLGDGRFEPRKVKLGQRGQGFVEIIQGVREGDRVVTSANFLIDAESNLKSALQGLSLQSDKTENQHASGDSK